MGAQTQEMAKWARGRPGMSWLVAPAGAGGEDPPIKFNLSLFMCYQELIYIWGLFLSLFKHKVQRILLHKNQPQLRNAVNVLSLFFDLLFCLCYCSVTNPCLTLCNPMDCSTPGSSVLRYLLEFDQILCSPSQ